MKSTQISKFGSKFNINEGEKCTFFTTAFTDDRWAAASDLPTASLVASTTSKETERAHQTDINSCEDGGNHVNQQDDSCSNESSTPGAIFKYDDSTTQTDQTESDDSDDGNEDPEEAVSFQKVTRLGVRVQGDMPKWDKIHKRFVSPYYDTFDENYRAVVDTVNMASVEGAFKYVQAECINASVVTSCERKNNVKYVVFFQTTTVQPPAAMKYYANTTDEYKFAVESCPFIPMDGGQCHPKDDGSFPDECNQYIGANGQPELGFCVGGSLMDSEPIAPYPHNYWFSFPNSCPQKLWANKTDSCREKYNGGMCPLGKEPDGKTCTFSYEILGYILLDDVVGITSMVNPATGKTYADYSDFCKAGGVEFNVVITPGKLSLLTDFLPSTVTTIESIEFWANPGDSDANAKRIEKLVSAYAKLVASNPKTSDGGLMRKLPTTNELKALNPPCHVNSPFCAKSKYGCKRSYLSQICQSCTSNDSDCEKPKHNIKIDLKVSKDSQRGGSYLTANPFVVLFKLEDSVLGVQTLLVYYGQHGIFFGQAASAYTCRISIRFVPDDRPDASACNTFHAVSASTCVPSLDF
ncbi:hypothetical protein Plhal304r1_c039g0116791 [Plasmopara halstedii]